MATATKTPTRKSTKDKAVTKPKARTASPAITKKVAPARARTTSMAKGRAAPAQARTAPTSKAKIADGLGTIALRMPLDVIEALRRRAEAAGATLDVYVGQVLTGVAMGSRPAGSGARSTKPTPAAKALGPKRTTATSAGAGGKGPTSTGALRGARSGAKGPVRG